jgi:hypothetical protein
VVTCDLEYKRSDENEIYIRICLNLILLLVPTQCSSKKMC